MSQPTDHDYSIGSGQSGTNYRTADNEQKQGVLTHNSGSTAPTTTFPYMFWIDTSASPPELNMRNGADDGWIKLAEVDTSDVKFFSELAAVVGLANTDAFTADQRIEKTGSAANFKVKSDIDTGIAASLDLAGENDANEEIIAAALDASVTDNTDGSEDTSLAIKVLVAGAETTKITVGSTVTVSGTLNATTLQQGGTSVADLIEAEKGNMSTDSFSGAVTVNTDLTRGERNKFTGSSAANVTVDSGTAGDVFPIMNDGTAALTFVASGTTLIGATGLAAQKVCTLEYVTATRVFIYGENA